MTTRARPVRRLALFAGLVFAACSSGEVPPPRDAGGVDREAIADVARDAASEARDVPRIFGDDVQADDVQAADAPPPPRDVPAAGAVEPPFGGSSGGAGGASPVAGEIRMAGVVTYRLIVPSGYRPAAPTPFLVVYSGTEGGATMTRNLQGAGPSVGLADVIMAVLDGVVYRGNADAGAAAIDAVRAAYNVDNDRTYLLGESAGTTAALALGFRARQSYFAAYWANDVNASGAPALSADALGFAPWGNAGPGGDLANATAIVDAMRAAGYRIEPPAPYDGPGSTRHGDPNQFIAALRFFVGRSRR